jgi:hypothetical protein
MAGTAGTTTVEKGTLELIRIILSAMFNKNHGTLTKNDPSG